MARTPGNKVHMVPLRTINDRRKMNKGTSEQMALGKQEIANDYLKEYKTETTKGIRHNRNEEKLALARRNPNWWS